MHGHLPLKRKKAPRQAARTLLGREREGGEGGREGGGREGGEGGRGGREGGRFDSDHKMYSTYCLLHTVLPTGASCSHNRKVVIL